MSPAKADWDASLQVPRSAAKRPFLLGYSESATNNNSAITLSLYSGESSKNEKRSKNEESSKNEGSSKHEETSKGQAIDSLISRKQAIHSRFQPFSSKRKTFVFSTKNSSPHAGPVPRGPDSNRAERDVGAVPPLASEGSRSHQVRGRRLNYTPMFASLQSPLGPAPGHTRDISGNQRPLRTFEITSAVEHPMDVHAVSLQAQIQDGKPNILDLEAQRSNSSS
ncbi:hypothetical protein MPDQ_005863 [Monascus purpureus]|uniref:Uncharacterized protein n=1 Tax=Monascus purpureus TaxID=5098 RepID=A0A507QFZ1_MONPU|nr:hypothetical protein MPDQ_005863 [Monascus purpureus]